MSIITNMLPEGQRGDPHRADTPETHHLVVLHPEYFRLIRGGHKRLECRMSRSRIPPYGRVRAGDVLWLKPRSGEISASCDVRRVWQFDARTPGITDWIRRHLAGAIHAEPEFWQRCESARYGVLIWLGPVRACRPFQIPKRDRRGWVVLPEPLHPDGSRLKTLKTVG